MNHKDKLFQAVYRLVHSLVNSVVQHPAELVMLLFCTIVCCADASKVYLAEEGPALLTPFFVTSALCLSAYRGKHIGVRIAYYAIPVLYFLIPLFFSVSDSILNRNYTVLCLLLPVIYLVSKLATHNKPFAQNCVRAVFNTFFAMAIPGIVFLVIYLILATIQTLFGVDHKLTIDVSEAIAIVLFVLVAPMMFIGLEDSHVRYKFNSILQFVVNYILSTALIIYTLILYIYAAKILICWELPHGEIATMVTGFMSVALITALCRHNCQRVSFRWFFDYLGFISLPLLALFWIGTLYRIAQYGFTISRCYLVFGGILMVLYVILIIVRCSRTYFVTAITCAALALILMWGGPLSAHRLSIASQAHIIHSAASQIGCLDSEGHIVLGSDSTDSHDLHQAEAHRRIYQALLYIEENDTPYYQAHYPFSPQCYLTRLSESTQKVAIQSTSRYSDYHGNSTSLIVSLTENHVDIGSYTKMSIKNTRIMNNPRSPIPIGNKEITIDEVVDHQLKQMGYSRTQYPSEEELQVNQFCVFQTNDYCILFDEIALTDNGHGLEVEAYYLLAILEK